MTSSQSSKLLLEDIEYHHNKDANLVIFQNDAVVQSINKPIIKKLQDMIVDVSYWSDSDGQRHVSANYYE
jgi:hypothetical protein